MRADARSRLLVGLAALAVALTALQFGSQTAPGNALRVLVYDIYTNAFQFLHMGYASAEAVMLTMIVLGLTLIQFRAVRSDTAKEA